MKDRMVADIYETAKDWILEAGANIRNFIHQPLHIYTKTNQNDLVTTVDRETEMYFANKIKATFPDHFLLGEEGYGDQITDLEGVVWIIDPIDGTINFIHQKRNFAISVGIYIDGIGEIGFIYDVMGDFLYHAKRGEGAYKNHKKLRPLARDKNIGESIIGFNHQWLCENTLVDVTKMQKLVKTIRSTRTVGSAALEFAYVAEGSFDAYLSMGLSPWDFAAGLIIVNEVGGITTNTKGEPINLLERNTIATGNRAIHHTIIKQYLN